MCERMNEKQIFLKILRILSGSHLLFVQLIADDKKRNFGEFDEIRCVTATHLSCPQNNTHKGVFKCTPFHVLPEHTLASYLNTPWCVPKTHLKLCFGLVLNLTHFQVCSAERCVLSHFLMCNKAHL